MPRELKNARIVASSGFDIGFPKSIPFLKKGRYRISSESVGGDAPKDFLKIYEYGRAHRSNPKAWPSHIAKVGQKWYPNESITEQLVTRIGEKMGLNIAESQLMFFGKQLRFLSRYFLRKDESLIHGAQIFAGYLNDRDFVENVELQNQSRSVFTYQFVEDALLTLYPDHVDQLLYDFTRLLAFDCVVGNNDRHFYNWGVIVDLKGKRPPRFSPIYDSARAFLWNTSDEVLQKKASHPQNQKNFIAKYVKSSLPKTGWDDIPTLNHFELIAQIAKDRPTSHQALQSLKLETLQQDVESLLNTEFKGLFSELRKKLILECLDQRVNLYLDTVHNHHD